MVMQLNQLGQLSTWAASQPAFNSLSITPKEIAHFNQAVATQKMGPTALRVYQELRSVVDGSSLVPDRVQIITERMDQLLEVQRVNYTRQFSGLKNISNIPVKKPSDDLSFVVPMSDDPRAIQLPCLKTKERSPLFISGYDSKKNTLTLIIPTVDAKGQLYLLSRIQDADTGEIKKVIRLDHVIYQDPETHVRFFTLGREDEAVVFALKYDFDFPGVSTLDRYPSYQAAGFQPLLEKSTLHSYSGEGDAYEHYHLDIPILGEGVLELAIIEDAEGGVNKVTDFRMTVEFEALPELFRGKKAYKVADELFMTLNRRVKGDGFEYHADLWHNLESENINQERLESLTPLVLNEENGLWTNSVFNHSKIIKHRMMNFFYPKAVLKDLYKIKKTEGLAMVHEIIMSLYHDEDTQLHLVEVLKMSENLPLPLDTRIIPTSKLVLDELVNFLTQRETSGRLSHAIMQTAQQMSAIPPRFIEGVWLGLQRKTLAAANNLLRGASTPEFAIGAPPVMAMLDIVDESHTGLSSTKKSRLEQRDRVLDMFHNDFLSVSLKHYLGTQLELAENFDLLILDSGHLFLEGKKVHPLEVTTDGQGLVVIDHSGRKFVLQKDRVDPNPLGQELILSEDNLSNKKVLLETHTDDPFKYVWLTNSQGAHGGSFESGGLFRRDDLSGGFKRPTPLEVAESLQGLLPLPKDYLNSENLPPVTVTNEFKFIKGGSVKIDMSDNGYGFEGVPYKKIKMISYLVDVDGLELEFFIPSPKSKTAQALAKKGYYVAKEEDLAKITKYYLSVVRKGFLPEKPNLYLLPGMMTNITLGFYLFDDESLMVSSIVADNFEEWAAGIFYDTIRHEIAHSVHRINPWISSLAFRTMALDGVSMEYGNTNIDEYWAVLVQNFFDHPENRNRFPNGYRLVYTLLKLREQGKTWDGPHNIDSFGYEIEDGDRLIDGTDGVLRTLATGGFVF